MGNIEHCACVTTTRDLPACPAHGPIPTAHYRQLAEAEVGSLRQQLEGAVDLLREIGAMAGAKANGADARAMAKRARDWLDSHGGVSRD